MILSEWSLLNEDADTSFVTSENVYDSAMALDDLFDSGIGKLSNARQRLSPCPLLPLVFIIFDTNVWLKGLNFISEVYENLSNHVIYVPDMVAIELNTIKTKRSTEQIRKLARHAIDFINRTLSSDRVRQQKRDEAMTSYEFYKCFNNDDKIIATCLQLRREGKEIFLCTNDKSMQNFAYSNSIPLYHQNSKRKIK